MSAMRSLPPGRPNVSEPPASAADFNTKILTSLTRWIREHRGVDTLARVASASGLRVEELGNATRWITQAQFSTFLESARKLVDSDDAFMEACVYRFQDNVGVLRFMSWALTPEAFFDASVKMAHVIARVGSFERVSSSPGRYVLRYRSTRERERLACLSRMAQSCIAPTIWGLPRAQIREHACLAHGDDYCEYELRWVVKRRAWRIIAGALIGAGIGFTLGGISLGPVATRLELLSFATFAGASLTMMAEQRRAISANSSFAEETATALRTVAADEAEARAEIVALSGRQREWVSLLEDQLAERTAAFEKIVATLGDTQRARTTTIRSFSHDLRNPLFVLKGNLSVLRDVKISESEREEIMSDLDDALTRIEKLLTDLMDVVVADAMRGRESIAAVRVAPLTESYRRRLRALVHGRDIKVSVFATRDQPVEIRIDRTILDRIVDNLLTNAAKYTERGSIVLEIGGTPGFLTLKLSDTGCGIDDQAIDSVFKPREKGVRTARSQGFGLSSVVQLLGALGGRIEVMSRVGTGTTFWAHIPEVARLASNESVDGIPSRELAVSSVVTIRKAEG